MCRLTSVSEIGMQRIKIPGRRHAGLPIEGPGFVEPSGAMMRERALQQRLEFGWRHG